MMHPLFHHSLHRGLHSGFIPAVTLLLASCCLNSCGNKKTQEADENSQFHADNDIAMVVGSLADAISVGESLDSADYSFSGVLTDGTGRPLYTDLSGHPGPWEIEVVSPSSARIKNTKIGDLMVDDLRNYLVSSLELEESGEYVSRDFNGRRQSIYKIRDGYLVMTSKTDTTPQGISGEKISIILRR